MNAFDWLLTGRNNASDRLNYWPPDGVGTVYGAMYRMGWLVGIFLYPINRRRKWRQRS